MQLITYIAILVGYLCAPGQLSPLREDFLKAPGSESVCKSLLAKATQSGSVEGRGYLAAANMIMARHSWSPVSKYVYFKKGRDLLEQQISAHPTNTELRYLRYSIQLNLPFFLGYRGQLDADRRYLLQQVSLVQDQQLATMIRTVLQSD